MDDGFFKLNFHRSTKSKTNYGNCKSQSILLVYVSTFVLFTFYSFFSKFANCYTAFVLYWQNIWLLQPRYLKFNEKFARGLLTILLAVYAMVLQQGCRPRCIIYRNDRGHVVTCTLHGYYLEIGQSTNCFYAPQSIVRLVTKTYEWDFGKLLKVTNFKYSSSRPHFL